MTNNIQVFFDSFRLGGVLIKNEAIIGRPEFVAID